MKTLTIARVSLVVVLIIFWFLRPMLPELDTAAQARLMSEGDKAIGRGEYAVAGSKFTEAFDLSVNAEKINEEAKQAFGQVANANRLLGHIPAARAQFKALLSVIRTTPEEENYHDEAFVLERLGALEEQNGNNTLARLWLGEAYAVSELAAAQTSHPDENAGHDVDVEVSILARLVELDINLGNIQSARQIAGLADRVCKGMCTSQTYLLQEQGSVALEDKRPSDAQRFFEQARLGIPGDDAQGLSNIAFLLGIAAVRTGQFAQADKFFDEALRYSPEPLGKANIQAGRAELEVARGKPREAHQLFLQVRQVYRKMHAGLFEADAALAEGRLFASEGNAKSAVESFERAATLYRDAQCPNKEKIAADLAKGRRS